ncbi:MAG: phosphoglycerate dehydrogenase [Candidatus Aenigmarchaeota archaeon]|nr:phosphoglycerate dehydrogenase [Candidatus Aenigmarchaeota archaeon]
MKILIVDKLSQKAINILTSENDIEVNIKIGLNEEEIINIISEYDTIIIRSSHILTKKVIEKAAKLKIIGRAGVGYDNIDVKTATEKGIVVMNAPFGNVNSAAEHTIAMMFSLSRHIHNAHHSLKRQKKWDKKKYVGVELKNKIIGIIGLGKIGKIVGEICKGLKMEVICYDHSISAENMEKTGIKKVEFNELIKTADFITLHIPLTEETKNLIDKAQFEIMKDGVRIINVGRGGLINEKSLYEAIKSGKIFGAAIDVWEKEPCVESPLLELDEILATPHLGASTIEAQENVGIDIAHQIIEGLKKGKLINVVNGVEEIRKV